MSSCYDCIYFHTYPNKKITCLMKQDFCIINGKNVYPKECSYFKKKGDSE